MQERKDRDEGKGEKKVRESPPDKSTFSEKKQRQRRILKDREKKEDEEKRELRNCSETIVLACKCQSWSSLPPT